MDGTQVAVLGLDEIMADFYARGKEANRDTVEEIIKVLEGHYKNYIPQSELIHKEYARILLKEYEEFIEGQKK
ncbi:MAG TPA: hypothetical protein DDW17_04805 [Deltaproteobacteria bacterium]|nr:hypothetical protein [Deltaproteobacteria bacterium]